MPTKNNKQTKLSKTIKHFLFAIAGIVSFWLLVTPTFEFPDEQAHFATATYLLDTGSMPTQGKLDLSRELGETEELLGTFRDQYGNNRFTYHPEFRLDYSSSYQGIYESEILALNSSEKRQEFIGTEAAKYPPLYYRYLTSLGSVAKSTDIFTRLFTFRLLNLPLVLLHAYLIYLVGKILFKSRKLALTLTALVFLQPMFSFVSAGINSDNLHNLLFTALLYYSLVVIKRGLSFRYLLALGAITALDIYTKPQGFIGLAIVGIGLLTAVIKHRQWHYLLWGAGILALALVLGREQFALYQGLLTLGNLTGSDLTEFVQFSANKLLAQNIVWYWGVFKWLGVVLPPIYWQVANRFVLLSALGLAIYLFRVVKKKKLVADASSILFLLLSAGAYALIIFWFDWQHVKLNGYSLGIQARYFFPTIVAHLALMITGILSFGWNIRSRLWLRRGLLILFLWLQLGGLWTLVTSYHDTTSLQVFITQASQYKPAWVKGSWWYLWLIIYVASLTKLVVRIFSRAKKLPTARTRSQARSRN